MYLFPFFVTGRGPIRSIPILSHGLEIGIGFNVDMAFWDFGLDYKLIPNNNYC